MNHFSRFALLLPILLAACTPASPEAQLKQELDAANYCEQASDCTLIGSVCPFDCYIYVNQAEAETMKAKLDAYQSTCIYSCIASQGVECVQNKCQPILDEPPTESTDEE